MGMRSGRPGPSPATAWQVNVTADGRLIVAALGDGTIRWFRVSDGEPVLALFIHPDGGKWIAWTPQGYYDASLGADDLIGWQINHGYDRAPDFYPVSQFRDRFYRPDVIQRVLKTPNLDIAEAVREADQAAGQPTAQGRAGQLAADACCRDSMTRRTRRVRIARTYSSPIRCGCPQRTMYCGSRL